MYIYDLCYVVCAGNEGTNHGIELKNEPFEFAKTRLQLFKESAAYNKDFFAEPVFVEGESLLILSVPVSNTLYTFIYLKISKKNRTLPVSERVNEKCKLLGLSYTQPLT